MLITQDSELQALRKIGRIVAETLRMMGEALRPGITTRELDQMGEAYLRSQGARSAPRVMYEFPGATCISINNQVAHGIPGSRRVRAGDLVNIDVSAELDGFFADTGGTFIVPPGKDEMRRLCDATRMALERAMGVATHDAPLNEIGRAIEAVADEYGFTVIENLGSHGVGRSLHEAPEFIAGFYDPKDTRVLKENMVITIEPFLSTGARRVDESNDGWTLTVPNAYRTAQYEHTMVITRKAPIILTTIA